MSHLLLPFLCVFAFSPHVLAQDTFDWNKIEPSEKLTWAPCNANFECARLTVPLDYSNPSARTAAIALMRLPAVVPTNSSEYRGPILFNPGGPGGSGVDLMLALGPSARDFLGPQFDLVGFDPRGISRSIPRASFFASEAEREQYPSSLMSLNASEDAFGRTYANYILQASLIQARDDGSLRFINTESTARDMLKIVQAHGREKIQYWGFSYGTVLGTTFAEMFPDKVERLVIDGVTDPADYYSTSWMNNLQDREKTWNTFLNGCPNLSALTPSYNVVDYSLLRRTIASALYDPYPGFQQLASALHDLSLGNAATLYEMSVGTGLYLPPYHCPANASEAAQDEFLNVEDGQLAVGCNDGETVSADFDDVKAHYDQLCASSPWCDVWSVRMYCVGWPEYLKNYNRKKLSFTANTSFPLLVIGNTAAKVSKAFPGSQLLTQDSPGHCSIAAPSTCTMSHVASYFINGTLPAPDTICPVDSDAQLFPNTQGNVTQRPAVASLLSLLKAKRTREEELSAAARHLSQIVSKALRRAGQGI
ncbi:Abhydrolase-4 domain-containing protein [Favolaschia claudopus]|uniref:Abhydrolase-4 domain-containing protein n=1 Tax=Favolaschia claudopus TaxID=2862362 RepID=A0AAW0CUZ0_9AGAR